MTSGMFKRNSSDNLITRNSVAMRFLGISLEQLSTNITDNTLHSTILNTRFFYTKVACKKVELSC